MAKTQQAAPAAAADEPLVAPAPVADEQPKEAPLSPGEVADATVRPGGTLTAPGTREERVEKLRDEWTSLLTEEPPEKTPAVPARTAEDASDPAEEEPVVVPKKDDEPAEDEPAETEEEPQISPEEEIALLERFAQLERDNRQLQSLKGKMGKDLGDRDHVIETLIAQNQALSEKVERMLSGNQQPETTEDTAEEDPIQRLLEDPRKVVRQEISSFLAEERVARDQREADERRAIAPNVAFKMLTHRFKIEDADAWQESDEAKAVTQLVTTDPVLKPAMEASWIRGDYRSMYEILARAVEYQRASQEIGDAAASANGERERIEARKRIPPARPGKLAKAPAQKNILTASYKEILGVE